jgi:hypothetical protein
MFDSEVEFHQVKLRRLPGKAKPPATTGPGKTEKRDLRARRPSIQYNATAMLLLGASSGASSLLMGALESDEV